MWLTELKHWFFIYKSVNAVQALSYSFSPVKKEEKSMSDNEYKYINLDLTKNVCLWVMYEQHAVSGID